MSTGRRTVVLSLVIWFCLISKVYAEELRFYPMKSFSVIGEYRGNQAGTFAEHVDRHGNIRVEINDTTMSMLGTTIKTRERLIYEGDTITRIDLEKKTATRTRNPMYESFARSVKEQGGVKTGESYIRAMGGAPTGKQGSFAGEACDYWTVPSLGTELCVTDDAITLYSRSGMAGIEVVREAKEIKRGDPGPAEVYKVPSNIQVSSPSLPTAGQGGSGEDIPPNIQKMLEGLVK